MLPWVGLADLFAIQSLYGFEREESANPRALDAVNRALALNDQVAMPAGWRISSCCSPPRGRRPRLRARNAPLDATGELPHLVR